MKGSKIPIRNVHAGQKPWLLDLRYVGGRRQFYATKAEAETVRDRKLVELKNHGTAALALTDSERVDFVRARDRLKDFGATIAQAVDFYAQHHALVEKVSFEDAIARVCSMKRASKKDSEYVRKLEANLDSLRLACGRRLLSEVTRNDVEDWLFRSDWAPATIRNKRIDVRTFFHFAVKRHWVIVDPTAALEQVQLEDAPPGILKVDECECLLRATWPDVRPYIVLNLFCGIRPEECVQLRPEHIQVERGFVEVPAAVAKSRKRRLVDLSANAKLWLSDVEVTGNRSPKWYARQFPRLRRTAGKLLSEARGNPVTFPWPKNCLRHSFASYHLAMHGSADKTSLQMGHRSTDMLFRQYRELVTKDDSEKFWKITPTGAPPA